MFGKLSTLTFREIRGWAKSPLFSLSFLIGPFVWVFVFGSALSSTFSQSQGAVAALQGAPDYYSFVATGMFVVMPITFAGRSGTSIFADRAKGYLDRLLVSPTARETIVHAKIFGNVILGMVQAGILLAIAVPFGLKLPNLTAASLSILIASVLLLSYGFSSIFLMVSMKIRRWATQQFATTLVATQIMFLSNAFYPASKLPAWIGWLVSLNPVSYAINITRELFFQGDKPPVQDILLNFSVLAGFAAACAVALVITSRKWL